jgi:predicted protein tyrosine phosphatase
MEHFNKTVYNILCLTRNKRSLNLVNRIANIDDYNIIVPNVFLGNMKMASDLDFLQKNNIQAILNCTPDLEYHQYFEDKPKFRININDSKNIENINKFKSEVINGINFIEGCVEENKPVYVHCYWGLMRSATLVAGYIIKKYNVSREDAISIVKSQRPRALSSLYNFNEILLHVEENYRI